MKHDFLRDRLLPCLILTIALLAVVVLCVFSTYWIRHDGGTTKDNESSENESNDTIEEAEIKTVDFQPVIDEWAKSASGTRSVIIYDLENEVIAGALNVDLEYSTASLYKLFVVYEGYRRVGTGVWDADSLITSTEYSVLECLDLAIRESNSSCAEALWRMIGYEELDEIVKNDFKIVHSDISRLSSTPEDILEMLKIYYHHQDINDENLLAKMKDSFLNQPATDFDWRQGLPSGFSDKVKVYDKVGWQYNTDGNYWDLYHDAAIVEFPEENRHFIVVVMTSLVDYSEIRELGPKIEESYYQVLKN